jgi:peptidoglycan/LPS O-acetylase OafA/YrhL
MSPPQMPGILGESLETMGGAMLGFTYRLIVYALPVLMSNIEMQIGEVAKKPEAATLFAPSVAAAAVGLFMPAIKESSTSPPGIKKRIDTRAAKLGLVGVVFGLYLWHMLVAANLGGLMDAWVPNWNYLHLGNGGSVAILVYAVAVFLMEVKTAVEK